MALIHLSGRRRGSLIAALLAVSLAACQPPVPSAQEVAAQILQREAWVTDAKACPLDVMPSNLHTDWDGQLNCQDEKIADCLAQCRRHEGEACYWLAQVLLEEEQIEASNILFQRSCLLGNASGCTNRAAAMMHAHGTDTEVLSCTTRSFGRTCEAGDPWGCTMYGSALHRGAGIPRDDASAVEYFERACVLIQADTHESCDKARKLIEEIRGESGTGP